MSILHGSQPRPLTQQWISRAEQCPDARRLGQTPGWTLRDCLATSQASPQGTGPQGAVSNPIQEHPHTGRRAGGDHYPKQRGHCSL